MIALIGQGPGCIHLIALSVFYLLETIQVILLEALTNRSILEILSFKTYIKYIGRSLYSANNNLYGILAYIVYISSNHVNLAWIKNGDALIFNRGWCKQVFINSINLEFIVIPGITSAIANLGSINLCLTSKANGSVLFTCNDKLIKSSIKDNYLSFLYMAKLKSCYLLDRFVCCGITSKSDIIISYRIGSLTQSLLTLDLMSVIFYISNQSSPVLIVVGNIIVKHYSICWIKRVYI